MREMKLSLGPSKGKDGANTFGPMLVTGDEVRLEVQELGACSQKILPAAEVHRLRTGI